MFRIYIGSRHVVFHHHICREESDSWALENTTDFNGYRYKILYMLPIFSSKWLRREERCPRKYLSVHRTYLLSCISRLHAVKVIAQVLLSLNCTPNQRVSLLKFYKTQVKTLIPKSRPYPPGLRLSRIFGKFGENLFHSSSRLYKESLLTVSIYF